MWETEVDTQGMEAPVSHPGIHGETVDRNQPDVKMQTVQKKMEEESNKQKA